ncbi:MAG TPA: hypothetical protein VL486_08235 [Verrucomicrobiae bacterium]|nr:hypothetical protein [Verrucomicrobiae bacterium]
MKRGVGFALIVGTTIWGGCASGPARCSTASSANFYRAAARLPSQVHRVAMLPVTDGDADLTTDEGRDVLEPVWYAELRKRAVADVVVVTRDELWNLTGKREWTTAEALPEDFFERLHAATGCDAVVFCQLTCFRAYPPLGVGWKMQLVDVQKRTLWAADDVFDAGNPSVAAAARSYCARHFRGALDDSNTILMSPLQFGQYTAASVLETLPPR